MANPSTSTAPARDSATPLEGVVMSEYARKNAQHQLRTAEVIVDFFFDLFEGSFARFRAMKGNATKH